MDENFKVKEIKSWVLKSIAALNETGITQDIHVDELLKDFNPDRNADVFRRSCLLFEYIVNYLQTGKVNTLGISVFLSIDLIGDSHRFTGKPATLSEVEMLIDKCSVPEIIFFRDSNPNEVPLTEFYRVPILVDYFSKSTPIFIFYKEYRTFDELLSGGEFTRTLDVYYMQPS